MPIKAEKTTPHTAPTVFRAYNKPGKSRVLFLSPNRPLQRAGRVAPIREVGISNKPEIMINLRKVNRKRDENRDGKKTLKIST
jgi:hypothetical protein